VDVRAAGELADVPVRLEGRDRLRLSLVEREEIRAGIAAGDSFRAIARRIGRAPSTVSREVGGAPVIAAVDVPQKQDVGRLNPANAP
jgi:hypothetical protein